METLIGSYRWWIKGVHSGDLERWNTTIKFFMPISLITRVPFDVQQPNSARQHVGRGHRRRPYHKGRGPSTPNFGGSFYLCMHPLMQNYQIRRGNVREQRVSWGLPSQESGVPVLPNFGVLMCLCLHPLTQNDQIWHGNTHGEGRVLGVKPCHCVCTNASSGLSAIAEFLVLSHVSMPIIIIYSFKKCRQNAASIQWLRYPRTS